MKITTILARMLVVSALLVLGTNAANAAVMQHTYNFTASGFEFGAPVDPVVGSITATFDQAAVGSGSIDAITLNIGTHNFTVGEVGFEAFSGGGIIFGGTACAITCMASGTNDFWLYWSDFSNMSGGQLAYANSPQDADGAFFFSTGLQVTEGTVPEPATIALLGFGLLGFAAARRRRQ